MLALLRLWTFSQCTTVVLSLIYLLFKWGYYYALLSITLGFAIVQFKSKQVNENTLYLALVLFYFTQKPLSATLVPFASYSLFHALKALPTKNSYSLQLLNYQPQALVFSCQWEISTLFPLSIVYVFMGYTTLLTPVVLFFFIKQRSLYSPLFKSTLTQSLAQLQQWSPLALKPFIDKVSAFLLPTVIQK
jgi:hypothetical protein